MILFYIRHGQPTYIPDELTPLGRRQAEAVARRLAYFGVDEIYSSNSGRAMQTAQPLCEMLGKPLTTFDWLNEDIAFDEMAHPLNETRDQWIWAHPVYSQLLCSREVREMGDRWMEHPEISRLHPEVTFNRICPRLNEWIASLGYEHDKEKGLYRINTQKTDRRIALFAHEGVGRIVMSELLDIPYPYYAEHFEMSHSALTAIKFDEGIPFSFDGYARARVMTLSNDAHLVRDGLPPQHRYTAMEEIY